MEAKTKEPEGAIIKTLQEGIPLEREPIKALSKKFAMGEEELLFKIKQLKDEKLIRQISPIYDTKMLGYDSALVTFKVKPARLEPTARIINSHPGVSHNYEKDHEFNLWFTVAVPPDTRLGLDGTVSALAAMTETAEYAILRSKRVFKICVKLDPSESVLKREEIKSSEHKFLPLSDEEKRTVKTTQLDMPLTTRPFRVYAKALGTDEDRLITRLREFERRGVMRRFAAIPNHRQLGFSANAMAVWRVPEGTVEEIGLKIASFKIVSHCYDRTTNGVWRYNLFSMIHARSVDEVSQIVAEIKKLTGLKDYSILYSMREFKKRRLNYFVDDFYTWEESHITPRKMRAF